MSSWSRQAGHSLVELLVVLAVLAVVIPSGLEMWIRGMATHAGALERREAALGWRRMAESMQRAVDERVRMTAEGGAVLEVAGEPEGDGLGLDVLEIQYMNSDGGIRRWRLWKEGGEWWWRTGAERPGTRVGYGGKLRMRMDGASERWLSGNGSGDWWLETVADNGREAVAIRWGK